MKVLHACKECTLKGTPKTAKDILAELKVDPETVLIVKNKKVVTEDEPVSEEDSIEILPVASGG